MAIGLAASLAASIVIYVYSTQQINLLTAELANKTIALETRKQQIDQKADKLELLNLEILEGKIASNEQELAANAAEAQDPAQTVDAQKSEIRILKAQAARLQDDIQELEQQVQDNENEITLLTGQVKEKQSQLESFKRNKVSHYTLAVSQFDDGIVLPIEVEIIPSGEGTVSIDVKNIEYETGFQDAVRTAVSVASDYSDVSVSDKDIIIRVVNKYSDGTDNS